MTSGPTSAAEAATIRLTPGGAPRALTLGSRGSPLAQRQAEWVRARLAEVYRSSTVVITTIETDGDRHPDDSEPGAFTATLEDALRKGSIDAAVHSVKDLPVADSEGLVLAAICRRADPRDALVSLYASLDALPAGARVGTSSTRSAAQLLARRPDLQVSAVRGPVEARISRAREGEFDAVIVAAAGLERLGLTARASQILPTEAMLPAPGQGAIAIQCRADDREAIDALRSLDHAPTRDAVTAERAFVAALGGAGTHAIAALAEPLGTTGLLRMTALVASPDGLEVLRLDGSDRDPVALGERLAARALDRGAAALLA